MGCYIKTFQKISNHNFHMHANLRLIPLFSQFLPFGVNPWIGYIQRMSIWVKRQLLISKDRVVLGCKNKDQSTSLFFNLYQSIND